MALALVASGTDSNAAGASAFCGIPLPTGVQNGDVMIVAIALPAAGVTVTPPSSDWTQIVNTDASQGLILSVWWAVAIGPPVSLVFALSASCQTTGTVVVYRGADVFAPIDDVRPVLTASSASHAVAAATTSQAPEEELVFLAGAASGTYTPAAGFMQVAAKQQTGSSISAQHRQVQTIGVQAGFSETFSATAVGASVAITIAPSPGRMSFADAYQRLFEALPPGIDNVLDFTVGADFYNLTWSAAALLKLFVFDLYDTLKGETLAHLSRYKLPDWEGIFGLRGTRLAQAGSVPQRQAQVLGSWRAAAGQGSSIPVAQAVLQPLLGYNPTTTVQILEADASYLKLLHSYGFTSDLVIANGATGIRQIQVGTSDGGKVSSMGAQLQLAVNPASALPGLTITLTAPDGTSFTWSGASSNWPTSPVWLTAPSFKGASIGGVSFFGIWTLSILNQSGGSVTVYDGQCLFVEGMGRGQQTGGAIFEWGVYADPAHLGENGTAADLNAARAAVKKLTFAYATGNLIQSLAPWPNVDSGINASIPDECIPT